MPVEKRLYEVGEIVNIVLIIKQLKIGFYC